MEIPLPEKKFDNFVRLMEVVHPPNKWIDSSNVYQVLPLSHEYQMSHVTSRCEQFLMSQPPSIKLLVLADRLGLLQLHNTCIIYAREKTLAELEEEAVLEPATLVELLRYKFSKLTPKIDDLQRKLAVYEPGGPTRELSKQEGYELISRAPSVKNLNLADRYGIDPARRACINHLKDVKFCQLRHHTGFKKIAPATLAEILSEKVLEMEPRVERVQTQLNEIAELSTYNKSKKGRCGQEVKCRRSHGEHSLGTSSSCDQCSKYILEEIAKISKATGPRKS